MKRLLYIALPLILFSCQIEDENSPLPDDSFIRYYGGLGDQEAANIQAIFSAENTMVEGFVMFGTQLLGDSARNYYVVRTDVNGNFEDEANFGVSGFFLGDLNNDGSENNLDFVDPVEEAKKILVLDEGAYLTVGTSSYTNSVIQANDFRFISMNLLDAELNNAVYLQIRADETTDINGNPVNFSRDMFANDVIRLSDGAFLLIGAKENEGETDLDFYVRKFTIRPLADQDSIYWEPNDRDLGFVGTDDVLVRGFENSDGTITLFGYSESLGASGEGGTNVTYLLLNENGNILDDNSFGTPDPGSLTPNDDVVTDVIEIPGGYVVTGTTTTATNETYAFFISVDQNGVPLFTEILQSQFVEALTDDGPDDNNELDSVLVQTQGLGITSTTSGDYVIVGQYPGFDLFDGSSREAEAMFFRVNQIGQKVSGFESNYGLESGDDSAVDALTMPDGKIMVTATIDFGGGVKMISLLKLNDTGSLDR